MRILFVTRGLAPATIFGGPGIAVLQLSKALAHAGHDVTVYTSNLGEGGAKRSRGTVEQYEGAVRLVLHDAWYHYRLNPVTPSIISYCRRELDRYDVVSIHGYREFMGLGVALMARRLSIPYVIQPLGNVPHYNRSTFKKWLFDRFIGASLLRHSALIVARSELEREQLLRHGVPPEKLAVVPNGVDPTEFETLPPRGSHKARSGQPAHARLILFIGRIAPIKSIHLLIAAFARLNVPDARLEIVGPVADHDYFRALVRQVKDLALGDRVRFVGPLAGREKLAAFVDAEVSVLPSRLETFGLSAAESIAAGTPVILTEDCGLAEVVRDRVGLVVPHDADALARALSSVLQDPELQARFRVNCREVAASLDIRMAARELERVLLEVVSGSSGPPGWANA